MNRISSLFTLVRNKYYADLFRSSYYARLVETDVKKAIDLRWKAYHGHKMDWENPHTLDEKIAWLMAMTDINAWTRCSDKFEVRRYIEEIGLGCILTKCYGVWDSVDEIDFDKLPHEYVIKCTHDSGSTYFTPLTQNDLGQLKNRLQHRLGHTTCEPHYLKIKPRIIAEQLLKKENEPIETISMIDYKIWCFNGEPYCFFVCYDRYRASNGRIKVTYDLYDIHPWRPIRDKLSKSMQHQNFKDVPEPANLEDMLKVARVISKGFPQVRVDLYNVNGKIYFGEMTFTSASGSNYFFSDELKLEMGKVIDLNQVKTIY